jgi:hypothetical protein
VVEFNSGDIARFAKRLTLEAKPGRLRLHVKRWLTAEKVWDYRSKPKEGLKKP